MNKLIISALLLLAPAWASAGIISLTNNTGGIVDSNSLTQSVNVTSTDLNGFIDSIVDVNLTVDFSKCSANSPTLNGCVSEGGSTYNREIVFGLEHLLTSVDLVNQDTFSGQNTSTRVTQTYDDEAGTSVGGALLLDGSFIPVGSLSSFDGLSALGIWEFTFEDTVGSDPLVVHSWTLDIELREESNGNNIPVPSTLALLSLGLIVLNLKKRKRA